MRPRTRCQPNSARSLVHLNFPPLASSLPPFLVLRFRPSRNHISRPRALSHSSYLSTIIPLYSSGAWHYLGVLASPFIRFEIRRSFRFPSGGTYSLRVRLARSHLRSCQRGPHTSFLPQILPLGCVLPRNKQYSWYTN